MSDNTKMREAFVQACKEYGPTISFGDFEFGWDACMAWQAARTVPEGYVMVPVEPTQEMLKKSGLYDDDTIEVNCAASMAGQIYRAMLSAAPKKEGEK